MRLLQQEYPTETYLCKGICVRHCEQKLFSPHSILRHSSRSIGHVRFPGELPLQYTVMNRDLSGFEGRRAWSNHIHGPPDPFASLSVSGETAKENYSLRNLFALNRRRLKKEHSSPLSHR